jgi:IS30 family transposase
MIEYALYCQIRQLHLEKKLSLRQIARELQMNIKTVRKWAQRESFRGRRIGWRLADARMRFTSRDSAT